MDTNVDEIRVTSRAGAEGYSLVQRETDTGELVWSWQRGRETLRPSFPTRCQAVEHMSQQPEYAKEQTKPCRVGQVREHRARNALTAGANHIGERLDDTPHLWALIALIYGYLALFGLAVALAVMHR